MTWNIFKKKIDSERNIVDELANSLREQGKIDDLEAELIKLKQRNLNDEEIESWHHLYGISAFRKGNHIEASERFKNGLYKYPESFQIKFSLAQEFIFLGKPGKAFPLFDECVFPNVSREFALAMSRYAYLFSEYSRGINYIEKFFDLYREVKILDDHYLFMQGLPFFGTAWSHLAAHCVLSGNHDKLKESTEEIVKECHDYDFDHLNIELDAILTRDYSDLISSLIERRGEIEKYNGQTGYTDIKIAIFESFNKGSFQESISTLEAVKLKENDFPWLEEVRVLAKARAAYKFGEALAENEILEQFMANQSLLFEPHHAVSFGLLEYQELLKPRVPILAGQK